MIFPLFSATTERSCGASLCAAGKAAQKKNATFGDVSGSSAEADWQQKAAREFEVYVYTLDKKAESFWLNF